MMINSDATRDPFVDAELCLSSSLPRRWRHVLGVTERAKSATPLFSPEEGSVLVAAAILHDIGYAPTVENSGFHALDGALWLSKYGYSERICALVAHHSCARIESELRSLSDELANWRDEKTPLRDALWWADMTTTPDGEPTTVHGRIREIVDRYGPTNLVTKFIMAAEVELVEAVRRTEERLQAAGLNHLAK